MKVLGITCGRKNGNSELLLKQAFKAIEEKCGAETEFIRLQDVLSISEMGHFLNRTLWQNQAALTSSLRPWL
jgi:multimeric flavodoxin WrbA